MSNRTVTYIDMQLCCSELCQCLSYVMAVTYIDMCHGYAYAHAYAHVAKCHMSGDVRCDALDVTCDMSLHVTTHMKRALFHIEKACIHTCRYVT